MLEFTLRSMTIKELEEKLAELREVNLSQDDDVIIIGVVSTQRDGDCGPRSNLHYDI